MTFASVPAIRHQENIAKDWLPKITARVYDLRNILFFEKLGLTISMAMTENRALSWHTTMNTHYVGKLRRWRYSGRPLH